MNEDRKLPYINMTLKEWKRKEFEEVDELMMEICESIGKKEGKDPLDVLGDLRAEYKEKTGIDSNTFREGI